MGKVCLTGIMGHVHGVLHSVCVHEALPAHRQAVHMGDGQVFCL